MRVTRPGLMTGTSLRVCSIETRWLAVSVICTLSVSPIPPAAWLEGAGARWLAALGAAAGGLLLTPLILPDTTWLLCYRRYRPELAQL